MRPRLHGSRRSGPTTLRLTEGVSASKADLLQAASAAVRASWASEGDRLWQGEDAGPMLDWLVNAATTVLDGEALESGGPAANPAGVHMFEVLSAEVDRVWNDGNHQLPPSNRLELLHALEKVRMAIAPVSADPFVSQLSGPDGLSLVEGLAHDLRSPLTSMLFLADTLGRGRSGEINDLQRQQLRLIYSAALALNMLATDVIEMARGADQLVEKETESFSLSELLERLRDTVLPIAQEKGVELRCKVPPTDRRVGPPLALSRVLLNLTTNALKFTDKGFVEIAGRSCGFTAVEFSVRDTGRGISPEAMEHLYEPFRRSPGRRRGDYRFSGSGLGLLMCRRIVEAMGSELKYRTRAGWGTRFYFQVELPPASRL